MAPAAFVVVSPYQSAPLTHIHRQRREFTPFNHIRNVFLVLQLRILVQV